MFELGYMIYFASVGLNLLVCVTLAMYLAVRFRSISKTRSTFVIAVLVLLLFFPARLLWNTRIGAIPGHYQGDGAWGHATLEFSRDGSFKQTWHFVNEYNGKPEGDGQASGSWMNLKREWFDREIKIEGFVDVRDHSQTNHPSAIRQFEARGYGGVTSIEVDSGSDIVFFKH